ncbi:4191_t:CDS:2, partial [Racocetra persica]
DETGPRSEKAQNLLDKYKKPLCLVHEASFRVQMTFMLACPHQAQVTFMLACVAFMPSGDIQSIGTINRGLKEVKKEDFLDACEQPTTRAKIGLYIICLNKIVKDETEPRSEKAQNLLDKYKKPLCLVHKASFRAQVTFMFVCVAFMPFRF